MKKSKDLIKPFRIEHGKRFRLKDHDPGHTAGVGSKAEAEKLLKEGIEKLADLQDRLYAQDNWALLLVFQAMDAAGKDGVIKHVMSGVNPQGCQVYSFKAPSPEELDHDYLWRTMTRMPERGRIGIFNRSYYEEVLVVRVHPELLAAEHIPPDLVTKDVWKERFEDINAFERYLTRNGVIIRKFFLNLSKKEQKKRFLARLDEPEKNWKFSAADVKERACWYEYMEAFEDMICHTATPDAPWHVIPADNKWFTRIAVAEAVIDTLESLKLSYPKVDDAKAKQLAAARKLLDQKR